VARTELPAVADALRAPIGTITDLERTERPLQVAAVGAMERAYGAFTDDIGTRQRTGCGHIDQIAMALHDIATVYRRADGQG